MFANGAFGKRNGEYGREIEVNPQCDCFQRAEYRVKMLLATAECWSLLRIKVAGM